MLEWIELVKDALLVVVTAVCTSFVQRYVKDRSDRAKLCKGYLQEIRQNARFAKHNVEQVYGSARTLFFRDDFWNMSKAGGHFLDLPSSLQTLLYEIYIKQYEINEDLNLVGKLATLLPAQEKIRRDLMPKLIEAQMLLKKVLDP